MTKFDLNTLKSLCKSKFDHWRNATKTYTNSTHKIWKFWLPYLLLTAREILGFSSHMEDSLWERLWKGLKKIEEKAYKLRKEKNIHKINPKNSHDESEKLGKTHQTRIWEKPINRRFQLNIEKECSHWKHHLSFIYISMQEFVAPWCHV